MTETKKVRLQIAIEQETRFEDGSAKDGSTDVNFSSKGTDGGSAKVSELETTLALGLVNTIRSIAEHVEFSEDDIDVFAKRVIRKMRNVNLGFEEKAINNEKI